MDLIFVRLIIEECAFQTQLILELDGWEDQLLINISKYIKLVRDDEHISTI